MLDEWTVRNVCQMTVIDKRINDVIVKSILWPKNLCFIMCTKEKNPLRV